MHCLRCGHGPVIDGVCRACRAAHPAPYGAAPRAARRRPPLLWLPVGAFALAAFVAFVTLVDAVSGSYPDDYSSGYYSDYYPGYSAEYASGPGPYAGAVALVVVLGAGLVALRLIAGRPAARAFALIGSVVYLIGALFDGEVRSAATVLPALLCVAASATLAVSPGLRAFFAPPGAPPPRPPTSIVVVRTILIVSGVGHAVNAFGYLVAAVLASTLGGAASRAGGELGSLFGGSLRALGGAALAAGLVMAVFAVLLFWVQSAVGSASRAARVVLTVLVGLDLFAVVLLAALGLPLSLWLIAFSFSLVAAGALWFPADARRHFREPPLPAVERARGAVVGVARYLPTISAGATTAGPYGPPIPAPRTPAPPCSPATGGATPVPPAAAAPTPVVARSGRHAAAPGSAPFRVPGADTAGTDPATDRFAAIAPAPAHFAATAAAVPDEPPTTPVPVVGPAGMDRRRPT